MAAVSVDAGKLVAFATEVFVRAGCPAEEAAIVAEHLVDANLCGHDSHGIVRLARYVDWLDRGWLVAGAEPEIVTDAGAILVMDARQGFGQRVTRLFVDRLIDRASGSGVALGALRNAGHIGRVGAYAERAAEAGLASLYFVNVRRSCLVAPFGSRERVLSTAPFSAGVPRRGRPPVIADFATSAVAEGKCLVAARGGKPLANEPLISAEGEPTGDPRVLYGETIDAAVPDPRGGPGALRAMGLHKGSALAVFCELLGGALTGNGLATDKERPVANGVIAILFDPARLGDPETMAAEVEQLCSSVGGAAPAADVERVLLPGDAERAAKADRLAHGLPLDAGIIADLRKVGARFDVDPAGVLPAA
ncbi:Ldh family oxidoreductase [Geminicoccaceae bacterium 1502E]|nr:Ldh family oxidoreductase [Geminicoccaceae bacterium 1502E]